MSCVTCVRCDSEWGIIDALFENQIWEFLIGPWQDCECKDKAVHELQEQAFGSPFEKVSGLHGSALRDLQMQEGKNLWLTSPVCLTR